MVKTLNVRVYYLKEIERDFVVSGVPNNFPATIEELNTAQLAGLRNALRENEGTISTEINHFDRIRWTEASGP